MSHDIVPAHSEEGTELPKLASPTLLFIIWVTDKPPDEQGGQGSSYRFPAVLF